MCGIWGVFHKKREGWLVGDDADIIKTLMVVTGLRGDHSTGICTITGINNFVKKPERGLRILRTVGSAYNIFHRKEGDDYFKWLIDKGCSAFGHGRLATRGAITARNAHPFEEGNWVLVHNGTIRTGVETTKEIEVDSHALCKKIDEVGIKKALQSIDGAYAIIAYNKKEDRVYAARNTERSLFYFEGHEKVYVQSEDNTLRFALLRHNRYVSPLDKPKQPMPFEPEFLYVLTPEGFVKDDCVRKEWKVDTFPKSNYQPPALPPPNNSFVAGQSDRTWKRNIISKFLDVNKKPKPEIKPVEPEISVAFTVDDILPAGQSCYRYICTSDNPMYRDVFFFTKEKNEELKNKLGEGELRLEHYDKMSGKRIFLMKYRDITWTNLQDVIEGEEDEISLPTGTTCVCCDCAEEVKDLNGAVVLHDEKVMCAKCVHEWEVNYGTRPREGANV